MSDPPPIPLYLGVRDEFHPWLDSLEADTRMIRGEGDLVHSTSLCDICWKMDKRRRAVIESHCIRFGHTAYPIEYLDEREVKKYLQQIVMLDTQPCCCPVAAFLSRPCRCGI